MKNFKRKKQIKLVTSVQKQSVLSYYSLPYGHTHPPQGQKCLSQPWTKTMNPTLENVS